MCYLPFTTSPTHDPRTENGRRTAVGGVRRARLAAPRRHPDAAPAAVPRRTSPRGAAGCPPANPPKLNRLGGRLAGEELLRRVDHGQQIAHAGERQHPLDLIGAPHQGEAPPSFVGPLMRTEQHPQPGGVRG